MSIESILTLIAIVVGPIAAVLITRWLDSISQSKQRKYELFKALMQTRGKRLDPVHVSALNVIELEFFKYPKVRDAFKKYVEHLSSPQPSSTQEEQNKFYDQRSDLFMELIFEVGNAVGYKFDKRELDRRSYAPKGWNDDHFVQQNNAIICSGSDVI